SALLLQIDRLTKSYPTPESGGVFTVLEGIDLRIESGEIVAILGRSGSGKSTLLRSIAGLVKPTSGSVISAGRTVNGPNPDVSLVFQTFALLPWLSVQQNVEVGLQSHDITDRERRKRSIDALRMVGLDGFANAYPKELSGGMQQRVGFARALVVRPRLLLLDEPFSALDVLTAENLRGEIDDLWQAGSFPAESVVIVTNNIEEAIILADRVVVLGSNPSRIRGEIKIPLNRPRSRASDAFRKMADHIYTVMTHPEREVEFVTPTQAARREALPEARPGAISGLLELLHEYGGSDEIAVISERLRVEADEFLPILDAATLLGFATVDQGDVVLTTTGVQFAMGEIDEAKVIFREGVLEHAPLVRAMHDALIDSPAGEIDEQIFLDDLEETFTQEEAKAQFDTAVNWGRYAGLFEYDSDDEVLRIQRDAPEEEEEGDNG
ncbi:MAG: nitrate/sulfonate/bicarbonate ABC transporter ATP-binding protein, partial [bacterium]